MASKPNAERIFRVVAGILQRKYEVSIEYTLDCPKSPGHFFGSSCYEKATEIRKDQKV